MGTGGCRIARVRPACPCCWEPAPECGTLPTPLSPWLPARLQDFLKKFAPHQGMLADPTFPSDYLPKTEAAAEGAAIPAKMQFNFFVPHETISQAEQVRGAGGAEQQRPWQRSTGGLRF